MRILIAGSADPAGIPVAGCACTLCRQARAVRHLRRRPTCFTLTDGNDQLLVEAPVADLTRGDWGDAPSAILLSSWEPPNWTGLVPMHLGKGTAVPVFGPHRDGPDCWLAQRPGRLEVRPVLTADTETPVGRFRVRPFRAGASATRLALGISCGEQRLVYLPVTEAITPDQAQAIAAWHPQAVVLGAPAQGRPEQRLGAVVALHRDLGAPALLLAGIDHHLDHWLSRHAAPLPDGIRVLHDEQRLEMTYLAEYRRLGELAGVTG